MFEAVIWDFGGVLTSSPFEAFARFEAERGLPADIIRRTNTANHLENAWAKFERAEVDIETFDKLFAAESRVLRGGPRGGMYCRYWPATSAPKWSKRSVGSSPNSRPVASPTTFQPMRSAAPAGARSTSPW
jgi:hypothetical protein